MSTSDLFLSTLKRIGYHDIDSLDDTDLNSLISKKELGPFFEVFSALDERNVLSTEEIEEYLAISSEELAEIEILMKNGHIKNDEVEYEEKKEVLSLQEQLSHLENHNKSIEKQIVLFKKHEDHLLEEKGLQNKLLLNAKERFQNYDINKIPQSEEMFVSNLESILEVARDLEILIVHSDARENKLPTSNLCRDNIQQYFNTEEKILQYINDYLQNNFQLQDNIFSFISHENSYRQELIKEASFLQKRLKNSMIDKVLTEKEIKKIKIMVKYFETSKISDYNSSQIRSKLEDAMKFNEQLKKNEHELKAYAFDAGSKHVEALLTEIDLCVTNEVFNNFQFCMEKMLLALNTLMQQKARLEILIALLSEHKQDLQIIRELIKEVLNMIKEEKLCFEERKILIERKMTEVAQKKSEPDSEAIVLSSLCRILVSDNSDFCKASMSDLLQKANKLIETKESCTKKFQDKMKTVDNIEKHVHCMESLLNCVDKEYSNWHELEQDCNVSLNNLGMKLASLEQSMSEYNQDLGHKQKILERKGNLRLTRNLYVHALLNEELFKKCIDDVKIAVENSAGYQS